MATGIPGNRAQEQQAENAYSLAYPGKRSEDEILNDDPATLVEVLRTSEAGSNALVFGDNQHVLLGLLDDPSVAKKVRLVYIDPPYATGSRFESRSQQHAYADHLQGASY